MGGMVPPVPRGFVSHLAGVRGNDGARGKRGKIDGEWKRSGPLNRLEGTELVCSNMRKKFCKSKSRHVGHRRDWKRTCAFAC